jgi:hypothetical protein
MSTAILRSSGKYPRPTPRPRGKRRGVIGFVQNVPLVTARGYELRYAGTRGANLIRGEAAMNSDAFNQFEADERILTFDIPDEPLERAASIGQQGITWVHCTHAWQYCEWPQ